MGEELAFGLCETLNGRMERPLLWSTNTPFSDSSFSFFGEHAFWLGLNGWLSTGTGVRMEEQGMGVGAADGVTVAQQMDFHYSLTAFPSRFHSLLEYPTSWHSVPVGWLYLPVLILGCGFLHSIHQGISTQFISSRNALKSPSTDGPCCSPQ